MYTINYDKQELILDYKGELYYFNLNNGDTGDYWNSFTHDGEILDINFCQEGKEETPTLSVYHLGEDGFIDMNNSEYVDFGGYTGNPENYF